MWPDTQRERDDLDRHITGNYGEDEYKDCVECAGCGTLTHNIQPGEYCEECKEKGG
jgi:hypothetical protein